MTPSTLTDSDARLVCSYMRTIRRDQMRAGWMRSDLTRFIKAEGLMEENHWPGYTVMITAKGLEFLEQHEGRE